MGAHRFLSSIIIVTLPIVGRYSEACTDMRRTSVNHIYLPPSTVYSEFPTHLLPHVSLEIFIRSDVQADTAVLQPRRLHLVLGVRHCRYDDVRQPEHLLQRERRRVHDVPRVEFALLRRVRAGMLGPLGVFLDRVYVDGEDACAVVRKERCERPADDF